MTSSMGVITATVTESLGVSTWSRCTTVPHGAINIVIYVVHKDSVVLLYPGD